MKFYPIQRRWPRIRPHLDNPELQRILVRDLSRVRPSFRAGMKPSEVDYCPYPWRFFDRRGIPRRGRRPAFWDYCCHDCCHWTVNFNLRLAELVEPKTPWRIVTKQTHSTVWDGRETLFDIHATALGTKPDDAWRLSKGRVLRVGREYLCYPKKEPLTQQARSSPTASDERADGS